MQFIVKRRDECPPPLSGRQHARPLYLGASMPAPFIWVPACPPPFTVQRYCKPSEKTKETPFFFRFFVVCPPFLRPFLASVSPLSPSCSGIGAPLFSALSWHLCPLFQEGGGGRLRGVGEAYFSQSQYSEQPFTIRCLKSKR